MSQEKSQQKSHAASQYSAAGVDLERGYEVVRRISNDLDSTKRPGAMSSLGRFGGLFDLASLGYKDPVLVSGTDGVGTKLFLAFAMDKHDTVGIDCVAMSVNDVLVQGAEPLFFLDYLALNKADPEVVSQLVSGVAKACRETNCALIGGETAEMNDLYAENHYDIAGFCVGVAERENIIDGESLQTGDVLLGLASSGCHSNGFSLLRKIYFKDNSFDVNSKFDELDVSLGEALLTPTRLYVRPVLELLKEITPHGMCHITGGGFYENLPRMSSHPFLFKIRKDSWPQLPIFNLTAKVGKLSPEEMFNIFNMGIGFVIALPQEKVEQAQEILRAAGEESYIIGEVAEGEGIEIL